MSKKEFHEQDAPEVVDAEELVEELEEVIPEEEETSEVEAELKRLQKLLEESDERYLRLAAEYDNYRKRTSKEKSAIYPMATAETIAKFLPILDNFERSLEFDVNTKEFAQGIEMIHQNFLEVLTALGAEPIGEVGEPFDPDKHNAVMHIEDPKLGDNVVSQVLQKGYCLGDRMIRHATVQTAN